MISHRNLSLIICIIQQIGLQIIFLKGIDGAHLPKCLFLNYFVFLFFKVKGGKKKAKKKKEREIVLEERT